MNTLYQLTVANVRSLIRDRAAIFWTLVFPAMFVFLFGAIFGGSGDTKIAVGYVDEDRSVISTALHQAFGNVELISLKEGSLEDEKAAMQRGDVSAVIVIPAGTEVAVAHKQPAALQVYTDPTKTQATQVITGIVAQVTNGLNLQLAGGSAILGMEQLTLSATQITAVAYLVPSILAMALMQLGVFAAIPLVQQREKGILKRMGATPLPRWMLVGSNVLLRLMVAILDAVVILGIGMAVFNVSIVGSWFAVAGLVLLGAGTFLALGFMLAAFLKTEDQASGVVQVVQIPMMFLSGIFFSFDFLPGFLQTVARLLPLTYLADALRQVMVNGTQVAPLGVDLAVLVGWLVICMGVATRYFRWE
jgi:ABC-2 type transport system permease protein